MRNRVTTRNLDGVVKLLNNIKGTPETSHTKLETGKYITNINNYHISSAYSGNQLVQTCNEHGGIRTVSTGGYIPKRELYNQINAMINILR